MRPVVVAIPAKDEVDRIGACIAALAMQRDGCGAPLPDAAFTTLIYANNCRDGTADEARLWSRRSPHPLVVIEEATPAKDASAGAARKRAMDLAADRLARAGHADGVILTTDADTCVSPTWVSATLRGFAEGADAVAGYIDAHATELVAHGAAFLQRSRLEDRYLSAVAEIEAICDPRPHDPWPNHRVSSGASLAVTLAAYHAIGGLPAVPVGEDAALTRVLEAAGFKVRHAMDVVVSTSCRFDGRAAGGAADTMRDRHANPDAPCDADMDGATAVVRRALLKARLRGAWAGGRAAGDTLARRLGLGADDAAHLADLLQHAPIETCWAAVSARSPVLKHRRTLRPSDLPSQIARAERALQWLRRCDQMRASRSSR